MKKYRVAIVACAAACGNSTVHHLADAPPTGDAPHATDAAAPQVNPGIYITDANNSIYVFDLAGSGDVAPTRTIAGSATGLALSVGIAVDRAGDIYVANREGSAVTVYAPDANGNAAPLRTLTATGMGSPETLALDADDNLFVATCPNCGASAGGDIGIFHFPAGATASDYSIAGSNTGLTDPGITIDPAGDLVVENSFGGDVETFPATAMGDVAPELSFSPGGGGNVQSVVAGDGIIALGSPPEGIDLYAASTTGSASPAATIAPSTMFPLEYPGLMDLDTTGAQPVLYVVDFSGDAIYVVETTGSGTGLAVGSVRTITGSDTMLSEPLGIAVVH